MTPPSSHLGPTHCPRPSDAQGSGHLFANVYIYWAEPPHAPPPQPPHPQLGGGAKTQQQLEERGRGPGQGSTEGEGRGQMGKGRGRVGQGVARHDSTPRGRG